VIPLIAAIICALVVWELFRLNREGEARSSKALWIPTIWLFLATSRNVSAWLQYSPGGVSDQYVEGSPLDRAVLTAILALGVIVLLGRSRRVGTVLQSNLPILLYFLYCGISIAWSDYPDVSFKRWFRALGDVVMVLIVLTDPDWVLALRRLLARVGFVLVPVSILFIRYFPQMGRSYTRGGTPTWTGVATDKNGLGLLSLVFGLAFIFRFLQLYRGEGGTAKSGPRIALGTLIVMTFYLLWEANSATAFSCYFLAGVPMVLTYLFRWARKPAILNVMVVAVLGVAFTAIFLDAGSGMLENLGRNSTLTGRTNIWRSAFGIVQNPLFGTGYESFWVGPRLKQMEVLIDQGVNQAHNGYIEVFLNLGWIGIAVLSLFLISGYGRIVAAVRRMGPVASLRLAYLIVAVVYNFTEAGFKMNHPVWITLLLVTMMLPEPPLLKSSPPLGLAHARDLAEPKPELAKSYLKSKPGKQIAHGVHREDLQRTRQS
jgi:exopolysaccharide production protein ExoQ